MKLVKEITTKTYKEDSCLIEETKQYHYDTEVERTQHAKHMKHEGYSDTGQVRANVGSIMKPEYIWFASYYKINRQ